MFPQREHPYEIDKTENPSAEMTSLDSEPNGATYHNTAQRFSPRQAMCRDT